MILTKYAAMAAAGLDMGFRDVPMYEPAGSYDPRYDNAGKLAVMEPLHATFISDKPLTKRQKRRLRGKS